jgi:hypothetical protein
VRNSISAYYRRFAREGSAKTIERGQKKKRKKREKQNERKLAQRVEDIGRIYLKRVNDNGSEVAQQHYNDGTPLQRGAYTLHVFHFQAQCAVEQLKGAQTHPLSHVLALRHGVKQQAWDDI